MPRQRLNAKQNCSVLFSFKTIELYREFNRPLTAEQLAIASHKAAHKSRGALGKQSSGSNTFFCSEEMDWCMKQHNHQNEVGTGKTGLETFLFASVDDANLNNIHVHDSSLPLWVVSFMPLNPNCSKKCFQTTREPKWSQFFLYIYIFFSNA